MQVLKRTPVKPEAEPGKIKWVTMIALCCFLGLVLVFTSSYAYRVATIPGEDKVEYALVTGNVEKPGYYKLNELSTNYDVLAQAGLNDSSAIQDIDLNAKPSPDQKIEVEVSEEKVKPRMAQFTDPRIPFAMGKTGVKRGLKVLEWTPNAALKSSDLIMTKKGGSAMIEFGNGAQVKVDDRTRLRLRRIHSRLEPKSTTVDLLGGRVMVMVPSLSENATMLLRTSTAQIQTSPRGTEFSVRASKSKALITVMSGKVKVMRKSDRQVTVLGKGQQLLVSRESDAMAKRKSEKGVAKEKKAFKKLDTEFTEYKKTQEEMSILIVSKGFNFVLSLLPKKRRVILMDIPPNTYVGDYIDGVFRMDQSVALVGSELTREVVQRLMGRPIPYVLTLNVQDVTELVYTIDGIFVEVDQGAAMGMGITPGMQRLTQKQIIRFLNPILPGGKSMAVKRQKKVLMGFLDGLKEGGAFKFSHYVVPLLRSVETNLPMKTALNYYETFNQHENWQIMSNSMPVESFKKGPVYLAKPRYDEIQSMYN